MRRRQIVGWMVIGAISIPAVNVVAEDRQLFSRIDANADGQISDQEIQAEGKPLYARLLRIADQNRDGKLNQEEFESGLKGGGEKFEMSTSPITGGGLLPGGMGQRPGADLLANIDRDKNGKISESEAPPRLKERFAQLDQNKDGELDRRELGAAMLQMRSGGGKPQTDKPQRPGKENPKPTNKPKK